MSEENNLEKRVLERGIIIVGSEGEISEIEEKYKDIVKIMDYEEGRDNPAHVAYLVPGGFEVEMVEHAIRVAKAQRAVLIVGYGPEISHGPNLDSLKFPEARKIEVPDLSLRENPQYLFEEKLNKNFNEKSYKSKIKGNQIDYNIKR